MEAPLIGTLKILVEKAQDVWRAFDLAHFTTLIPSGKFESRLKVGGDTKLLFKVPYLDPNNYHATSVGELAQSKAPIPD